jgi:hypothetical protein
MFDKKDKKKKKPGGPECTSDADEKREADARSPEQETNEHDAAAATQPFAASNVPSLLQGEALRKIATSVGLQALWGAVLPLVGVLPSRHGEFPGVFKVESGPGDGEATIYIDVPDKPYEYGKPSRMERVLTLNVKLEHDYRQLGERYYCVDCETPTDETYH